MTYDNGNYLFIYTMDGDGGSSAGPQGGSNWPRRQGQRRGHYGELRDGVAANGTKISDL